MYVDGHDSIFHFVYTTFRLFPRCCHFNASSRMHVPSATSNVCRWERFDFSPYTRYFLDSRLCSCHFMLLLESKTLMLLLVKVDRLHKKKKSSRTLLAELTPGEIVRPCIFLPRGVDMCASKQARQILIILSVRYIPRKNRPILFKWDKHHRSSSKTIVLSHLRQKKQKAGKNHGITRDGGERR